MEKPKKVSTRTSFWPTQRPRLRTAESNDRRIKVRPRAQKKEQPTLQEKSEKH